jgi:hypothetical protein
LSSCSITSEIGRELHAAGIEPQHGPQRLDQLCLGEARNADQKGMAAGQKRDQRALDHAFLTEDDRADRFPNL